MPDSGIASFGTQIQVLTSAPGVTPKTFATIQGVGDIDGPSVSIDETETTSHSTGVPIKTFIPALIDPGDLSFPVYWNPADPTQSPLSPYGLEKLFYDRKTTTWRLVAPDPAKTTREFSGYVQELGESYPVSGVCTRDTTVRISGAMAYVQAAATLSPASAPSVPAAGQSGSSITVTSADTTGWFPISDSAWITISAPTAVTVGNGSVTYSVAENTTGAARSGNIAVGDKVFAVSQLGS